MSDVEHTASLIKNIRAGVVGLEELRWLCEQRKVRQDMRPLPVTPSWEWVADLISAYDALAREVEEAKCNLGSLKQGYEQLQRQLAEAQQENTGLHDACARHLVENSKMNEQLREAQQRIGVVQEERDAERRRYEDSLERIAELEPHAELKDELALQLFDAEKTLDNFRGENLAWRERATEAEGRLAKCEKWAEDRLLIIAHLKDQLAQVVAALEALPHVEQVMDPLTQQRSGSRYFYRVDEHVNQGGPSECFRCKAKAALAKGRP